MKRMSVISDIYDNERLTVRREAGGIALDFETCAPSGRAVHGLGCWLPVNSCLELAQFMSSCDLVPGAVYRVPDATPNALLCRCLEEGPGVLCFSLEAQPGGAALGTTVYLPNDKLPLLIGFLGRTATLQVRLARRNSMRFGL